MRRKFFPAFLGAGLALALLVAATPADAQMHMKSKEEREAAEQKRKKAREDAQNPQATAAAPIMTQPPPAVCNPEVAAKPGVNTFEDILAMAGFGLGDLATAAVPAQDTAVIEWQPVVVELTEQ